jgi:hypothetical protein
MRRVWLWVLCCVWVGCRDVRVVPQDGGGPGSAGAPSIGGFTGSGGAPSVGGFAGSGGTSTVTTGPMGGSPTPGPVPGCESLELVGEPILLPHDGPTFSRDHSLVPLDGDRVGLVYRSNSEARTRILDDAFSVWPPTVEDAIVISNGFLGGPPVVLSSLPSGLFTLRSLGYLSETGVYAFGEAGAVRSGEVFWNMFLYPGPETPFDVVTSEGLGPQLLGFASLDAPRESFTQTVGDTSCGLGFMMATGETGTLFAAVNYDCEPKVDLYRRGSGGLELTAMLPLPVQGTDHRLETRPGGFWYFVTDWMEAGTYAYALDEEGVLVGEPWHDPYTFGDFTPHLRSWRNGFVGGHRDGSGVSMFVSDGFHRTDMVGVIPGTEPVLSIASNTRLAIAVGGPDSGSFLMAYTTSPGVLLARAECVTPL